MKRFLSILLAGIMIVTLTACTGKTEQQEVENQTVKDNGKRIGVVMPTQLSERWISDGANMKEKLEALGYLVDLVYGEDDIQKQVKQIETFINQEVDCLVVAAIDSGALVDVLEKAKEKKIPVIAYDRLLMDTDAVSYYATFDNKGVGTLIGKYIEEKKSLKTAKQEGKSYTIEFFMGSPDDNNAVFLYNGVMEVLQPYLDDGTLICKSQETSFKDTAILRWSKETAKEIAKQKLEKYYQNEPMDIACSAFDGFAYGIKEALEEAGYQADSQKWPVISGQDAELQAIQNIVAGSQTMTIYKDTRILADKCVKMVQAVLEGAEPEINDTEQYNNGKVVVPSYLCTPEAVDQENYQKALIDGGYYTQDQITGAQK